MEWNDRGIVLGVRKHGETSVIVEAMTEAHGRHLGLVRGGRSRRMQPVLQPGNLVDLTWRARLDEHLGMFQIEPVTLRAARLMETPVATYGVQALAALLRLLPERDPHPHLFDATNIILDGFDPPHEAGELFVRFEIAMLNELGFGLDLDQCAATGTREDLAFISPKSGRAVSRPAGQPYADRLFAMPAFLMRRTNHVARSAELADAFAMTGHFFLRDIYAPRGLAASDARAGFVDAVLKSALRREGHEDPKTGSP